MIVSLRHLAFSLPVVLLLAGTAHADDPSALVGRVSYIDGTVSFHAADQTQWSYATVNYPVTAGLSFWTEPAARSEIEIGSSQLRMESGTAIDVLRLDPATRQIQLEQGTINYRVTALAQGETIEIETPHGAVAITQPGTYHIDAGDATNPTVVAALEGEARLIGPQSYLDIQAGEQASAIGDPLSYTMTQAEPTQFDDWALQRDAREHEYETAKYVSSETTGYQDLDQYGTWQPSPQYGQVWIPQSVPAGWVPYREGHWAYVQPWGWTWIDDQPWGFAPFHYGRWAQVDNRWAWVPGQVVARPVYAPALVAFIGGPRGVDVKLNLGGIAASIGWLPLGPNEPYVPPYRVSPQYLRNVNYGTVNKTVINNINNYRTVNNYMNQPGATVVPTESFTNAHSIAPVAVTPQAQSLLQAQIRTNLATLKPTPFARAATASRGAPVAVAPGPTAEQQSREATQIRHEEPATLQAQGKIEQQPHQAAAPVAPHVAEATAPEVARPAAPGPAIEPRTEEQRPGEQRAEQHAAEQHAAEQHAEAKPEEARPQEQRAVVHPHEGSQPGTAPGPAVTGTIPRPAVPLRQPEVVRSIQQQPQIERPQVERQVQRPVQAAAPAPQPRAQPVVYKPVQVPKPVQAQPLRPTQAGWHRDEAKPAEKPAEGPQDRK